MVNIAAREIEIFIVSVCYVEFEGQENIQKKISNLVLHNDKLAISTV